jgi:hypothetical protein
MAADDAQPSDLFDYSDFKKPEDVRQGFFTLRELLREAHRRERAMGERFARLQGQVVDGQKSLIASVNAAMAQQSAALLALDSRLE